jgi:hypothetical protein
VFYLAQKASIIHLNLIRGILQNDEYIINMAYIKDVINKIKI